MAEYDVVDVKPVGPSRLAVTFADGLRGEVELRESFLHGVFEVLADPSVFAKVSCEQGFVEWPDDLDLAPDAMHRAIKERGVWLLGS